MLLAQWYKRALFSVCPRFIIVDLMPISKLSLLMLCSVLNGFLPGTGTLVYASRHKPRDH